MYNFSIVIDLATKAYQMIAAVSGVSLDKVVDPVAHNFEGRHDYALSQNEDQTILRIEEICKELFSRYSISEDRYQISYDSFGNLYVKYSGLTESPAVAHGSHVDSVARGGLYDGLSGIASGLIFLERLLECGQTPTVPFMFIAFRSEEASPVIAYPCLGSSIATGSISSSQLAGLQYGVTAANRTLLSEHFIQRYGQERWNGLMEEIQNPPLNPETIAYFLEVHPSQGRILQEMVADLGIVVGGIGGMQNREVTITPRSIKRSWLESPAGFASIKVTVIGRADHTGSALHNSSGGNPRQDPARIDALIGTQKLLEYLRQDTLGNESVSTSSRWGVAQTKPSQLTGFTIVPFSQETRLVVINQDALALKESIGRATQLLAKEGLEIRIEDETPLTVEQAEVVDEIQLSTTLSVVTFVERAAASLAADDESGALGELSSGYRGGLVRGTVTDFAYSLQEGATFKVNLRKGDEAIGRLLDETVAAHLSALITHAFNLDLEEVGKIHSDFAPSPVDRAGLADLAAIAEEFGLSALLTPSMPAHDIGRMISKVVGIAGNMLFLTDEGGSHVPTELVRPQHMFAGLDLAHTFLARKLGVQLSGGASKGSGNKPHQTS